MVKIEKNISLSRYTTLGIGGPAKLFARAGSEADFVELFAFAKSKGLPITIIGGGSNLLISDQGIDGLTILNKARSVCFINNEVRLDSGVLLASLARETITHRLTGLEWASGIPGTVGGAIIGNAGALGGQIADVLVSAEVYSNGRVETWHNSDFDFSYRSSKLKNGVGDCFVLSATIKLARAVNSNKNLVEDDRERRAKSYRGKTAGSYFKNPDGFSAGDLIERAGLKGFRAGDIEVANEHANVLRNLGKGTASDVLAVEKKVIEVVLEKFGIKLEPEVVKLGKF